MERRLRGAKGLVRSQGAGRWRSSDPDSLAAGRRSHPALRAHPALYGHAERKREFCAPDLY